jgi:protoporphyrinogen oxidase
VHAVSNLAHEVAPEYLKTHGSVRGIPSAVAALFTASGYGYPQDMPYAYIHEFVRSSLGQAWRVKGGYSSFWEKVTNLLPDVRCNVQVQSIQRSAEAVKISVVDSKNLSINNSELQSQTLEFDKVIISGSASIPRGNRIYRSSDSSSSGTYIELPSIFYSIPPQVECK